MIQFHGKTIKFGRKRPDPVALDAVKKRVSFSKYSAVLPAAPTSTNYAFKAMVALSQMYLNDQLGDCVIAGANHLEGLATANAGSPIFIATQKQIQADYSAVGGYVPGNPSTDNGCDEVTAMNYYQTHGFANGSKISGWIPVQATNVTQVMQAMWLFENLFFGIELPDSWVNPGPSASGFVWDDGTPNPNNGHCVAGVGYNSQGVQIDTWGMIGTITWKAVEHLCSSPGGGELYVFLMPDQVAKAQAKAPNGFDWSTLVTDFDALGGRIPVPNPSPSPTPSVTPTALLTQAQANIAQALTLLPKS